MTKYFLTLLLMLSCNSNIVRITQIPKEPPISENKNVKILLHLYDEPDAVKEK